MAEALGTRRMADDKWTARYGLGENEQEMLFVVFDLGKTQLVPGSDMPDHGQRSLPLGLIRLQLEDC